MTAMMQRWEMDGIGSERLVLRAAPRPEAGPGEVLVKVAAVSLELPRQLVVESGMGLSLAFPFTPGPIWREPCGGGAGATRFAAGDRVISTSLGFGSTRRRFGNARVPPYRRLAAFIPGSCRNSRLPRRLVRARGRKRLSDAEASTLPCAGLTAWFALVERGGCRPARPS